MRRFSTSFFVIFIRNNAAVSYGFSVNHHCTSHPSGTKVIGETFYPLNLSAFCGPENLWFHAGPREDQVFSLGIPLSYYKKR